MKSSVFVLFILIYNNYSHAQENRYANLLGVYFIDYNLQISLNICDHDEWYFTTCTIKGIPAHQEKNNCDIIYEAEGNMNLNDSLLFLKDGNGTLFFSFKVIDTLNLQVIYAIDILKKGDYLNRTISFFKGHKCVDYIYNLEFIKWEITDDKIYRYKTVGGMFGTTDYTTEKLPHNYWRKNY